MNTDPYFDLNDATVSLPSNLLTQDELDADGWLEYLLHDDILISKSTSQPIMPMQSELLMNQSSVTMYPYVPAESLIPDMNIPGQLSSSPNSSGSDLQGSSPTLNDNYFVNDIFVDQNPLLSAEALLMTTNNELPIKQEYVVEDTITQANSSSNGNSDDDDGPEEETMEREYRRDSHVAAEQRRRNDFKGAMDDLRQILPTKSTESSERNKKMEH